MGRQPEGHREGEGFRDRAGLFRGEVLAHTVDPVWLRAEQPAALRGSGPEDPHSARDRTCGRLCSEERELSVLRAVALGSSKKNGFSCRSRSNLL